MIKTNYKPNDWAKLITALLAYGTVGGGWVLLCLQYFLLPLLTISNGILKFTNEHEEWVEYLRTEILPQLPQGDGLIITLILIICLLPLGVWFTIIVPLGYLNGMMSWLLRKLKINPTMRLCIIRNNKVIFEF